MIEETESSVAPPPAPKAQVAPFDGLLISSLLRTFLILTLAVSSAVLTAFSLFRGEGTELFFAHNQVELKSRLLALGLAWGAGAVLAAFALVWCDKRPEPESARRQLSRLLAPLVVSCFIPALFSREAWRDKQIAYLCYLLAVGLALERLLRPALATFVEHYSSAAWWKRLESPRVKKVLTWVTATLAISLALAYVIRMGHLSNVSHMKLATSSSDLAEYDNLFFNALNGHPFRSPAIAGHLEDWNTLQGHAEFGLYMLLPFYAISPGAHTLLWIQATLIGLTAIPIYLLARLRLGALSGLGFALVYLLMPAVQQPNFYDFHFSPLGMFFLAWLLYFAASLASPTPRAWHRPALYVSMALALLCREDISIGIAVLGGFLVLSGALVRDGLILAAISGVYFFGMKFGIMPLFGRWWFDNMYDDIKAQGAKGFGAVVLSLVSNPGFVLRSMMTEPKFLYVLHMTVPVLALWLRKPLLWLAFLPGLVTTLLVSNRPPMYQSSFQYTYLWVPYVIAASIVALRRGVPGKAALPALVLVAASLSHQLGVFPRGTQILGGFSPKTFEFTEADQQRYRELQEIIALIPQDATVTVTEAEGPHVSSRLILYSMKYMLGSPDYLLVSHPHIRSEAQHLRQALESGEYGVIEQRGPFVLAQRGADTSRNDVLWRKVGRRGPPKQ